MRAYLLLFSLLISSSGCISTKTVERARGTVPANHTDENGVAVYDKRPEPGYYCLLPFSFVADVATLPIQLPIWVVIELQGKGSGWE